MFADTTVRVMTFTIRVHLNGRQVSAPITPHWKVLRSLHLHHSAPLEMLFPMASFFDELKIFRFWPKTMDYSPWFDFASPNKVLRKACHLIGNEKRNRMALVSAA